MLKYSLIEYQYPESDFKVFENLNLEIPDGVVSLIGQNGTGKSTLLLLGAGLIQPTSGVVYYNQLNISTLKTPEERQYYFSFVYQNMEFETEQPIGDLIDFVHINGFYEYKSPEMSKSVIKELELQPFLHKKTQELSKGELQRTIIAFSLLYGSKNIMMDEPIFALENKQKEKTMEYLFDFVQQQKINLIYSVHELELSQKYSEHTILFYKKNLLPEINKTEMIHTKDKLENAYEIPYSLLKKKELLYRETLLS